MHKKGIIGLILVLVSGMTFQASLAFPSTRSNGDPCRDAQGNETCTHWISRDARVNPFDAQQTMTAYCNDAHGLNVYEIIKANGVYLFSVSAQDLADGLFTAAKTGTANLIHADTRYQLYALISNQLQLNDSGSGYTFVFAPTICGSLPPGKLKVTKPTKKPRRVYKAYSTPTPCAACLGHKPQ